MADRKWKCAKCDKETVIRRVNLTYMGKEFGHELPVCPECGRVFIEKELVFGRMAEVEALMEDK